MVAVGPIRHEGAHLNADRIGCNNLAEPDECRGRPQKYCRLACKISAYLAAASEDR